MANSHHCLELPARRDWTLPSRLRDTIVTAETLGNRTAPIEEYHTQLYYASLNEIGELQRRLILTIEIFLY